MECKYTAQSVNISRDILDATAEHALETQITLPDFCSDIRRLLKCRVMPSVTNKSVSGDRLEIEGEAQLYVCYVDSEGAVRSYETSELFTHSFELPESVGDADCRVTVRSGRCGCRAVSERRIDVQCALSLHARVRVNESEDVITDIDDPTVQIKRGSGASNMPIGFDEKYLMVSDEMNVGSGEPIRSVLRLEPRVIIDDEKVIGSKVVVKGELLVKFLYIGEDSGGCFTASESYPFSQILDIPGLTESCTCTADAEVIACAVQPQSDTDGVRRKAAVSAKLYICVRAYCNAQIPYITDAYSTENALELDFGTLALERVAQSVNEPLLIDKSIDIPAENIEKIIDVWSDVSQERCSLADGQLMMKGSLLVCVLAAADTGEAVYFERTLDFGFACESALDGNDCEFAASVTPTGISAALNRGELEVKAEANVRVDVILRTSVSAVVGVKMGDKLARAYSASSIVVYRAESGEPLWDIAKRYCTSVKALSDLNTLTGDALDDEKTLVIPVGCV